MAVRDWHLVSANKDVFINGICVYLRVYSIERGGPCFMHLSNTKHRANDFRTLDSFWIVTLIKLPIRSVWEQAEKRAMLEYK